MRAQSTTFSIALLLTLSAHADPFPAKVSDVLAADLIRVERDGAPYDVRIYGADAPETGQPFAAEALAFTKAKALGQAVTVNGMATDNLGKIVGTVTLADGSDLGAALVAGGFAWWDEKNAPEAKALKGANAKALIAKAGLFQDPASLAPWDFRKSHGGEAFEYASKPEEKKVETKEPIEFKLKGDMKEGAPSEPALAIPGVEIPSDINSLIAKHKPRVATGADGKPQGITADDIANIPYAAALGLQNGDIITGVNGMNIRSEFDVLSAIPKLKGEKNFRVKINRGGQDIDIPVNLP